MENPQPFRVSKLTIFSTLMATPSIGWSLWLTLIIGLTLIVMGCFSDIRYLIFGLIVCMTMFPAVAFNVFVNYMFSSDMVANLLDHTVERRQSGYFLRVVRPANQDDPIEEGKEWIESGRFSLFDSNIVRKKITDKYEVIFFKDSPLSILYVPRY